MTDPFHLSYPNVLVDDAVLGAALQVARLQVATQFPAFSIPAVSLVAVKERPDSLGFLHAGIEATEMFFSGSLPKIAAMYAAYELRRAVRNLIQPPPGSAPAAAYALMRSEFDEIIDTASPLISAQPDVTQAMRLPKYEEIFATIRTAGGGFSYEFNGAFYTNMRAMIVDSNNGAAGACVKALGYSWLNGCLAHGGFFNTLTNKGIWLAGTYGGGWPVVRVPCANDVDTAQGMTCFDTANLYAYLLLGILCEPDVGSCASMLVLLHNANNVDSSFIDWRRRGEIGARGYEVTNTKIGIGPRTNGDVLSEASILQHIATGQRFIVVLQNLTATTPLAVPATLIDVAIESYLAAP